MILTVKHFIGEIDLAKAIQALSLEKRKITKKNVIDKARELLFIHGENAMDRDFIYDGDCVDADEAMKIAQEMFTR